MKLVTILALSLLVAQPVFAKATHSTTTHHAHSVQDQNDDLIEQGDYINSDGNEVHRPAHTKSHKVPDGAPLESGNSDCLMGNGTASIKLPDRIKKPAGWRV